MVVELARDPEALEHQHHPRAQVVQRVVRRRREVALLLAHRVAEPRLARVPVALGGVDRVVRRVRAELVRDLVEDEELALGPEVRGVGDARRAEVRLGALARRGAGPSRTRRRVSGSRTSQRSESVGVSVNGSRIALVGSGISSMSDSLIPCQPRIEEPSKPRPSSNADSSNALTGERHVLPAAEQVAELQVDHLGARLARPLERLPGVRQRAVRQVVPRLQLRHRSPPASDHEKSPTTPRVVRLHCLGRRRPRRATCLLRR